MTDDDPRPPSARLPPLAFGCIHEPPLSWDDAPPPGEWLVGSGDLVIIDDPPPRGGPMTDDSHDNQPPRVDAMKLYRVTLTKTAFVIAKSERDARGLIWTVDQTEDADEDVEEYVRGESVIPWGLDCLVYGSPDDLTLADAIERCCPAPKETP